MLGTRPLSWVPGTLATASVMCGGCQATSRVLFVGEERPSWREQIACLNSLTWNTLTQISKLFPPDEKHKV